MPTTDHDHPSTWPSVQDFPGLPDLPDQNLATALDALSAACRSCYMAALGKMGEHTDQTMLAVMLGYQAIKAAQHHLGLPQPDFAVFGKVHSPATIDMWTAFTRNSWDDAKEIAEHVGPERRAIVAADAIATFMSVITRFPDAYENAPPPDFQPTPRTEESTA